MFESTLEKEEKPKAKDKGPKPLTIEELENVARIALDNAVDFRDSEIQGDRELADKYYQGETRLEIEKGRSQVIVTKVRDAVKSVVPSLARIFTQTDEIAEFYSDDEEDQQIEYEIEHGCQVDTRFIAFFRVTFQYHGA
jgi:hypothetical protein